MGILVSKAPDDPNEKVEWANHMTRVQVAMWVDDGAECMICHHRYESVDDFLVRNPRAGPGFKDGNDPSKAFIDDACFPLFEKEQHG
jgi:hypothetical protein